jgi:predicted XRE-type DNA-binding protein
MQTRSRPNVLVTVAINQIHRARRLPAACLLRINRPKISALANYKLEGFSVERVMHFLNVRDWDVEITIRKKSLLRRAARIVVTQAQLSAMV